MELRVVIVTSGQPTANPRLIKEAITLLESGYLITVIYCPISPWADPYDKDLFTRYPHINWIRAGGHSQKNRINYLFARLRRRLYEYIFKWVGNRFYASERALVLFSQELKSAACNMKADMYIGHNLGALPAIVTAARKYGAKAVFDFEDYHRGEYHSDTIQTKMVKLVEEKYVPYLYFATTSAPLITKTYQLHFPDTPFHTIHNYFPHKYAPKSFPDIPESPLKLFWFSQYLGKNRGLEQVIAAIGKTRKKDIILTLLGNCSAEMKLYFLNEAKKNMVQLNQVVFLRPVPESEIVKIAAEHHVGLAVEEPYNQNRQLCLTNKIFMYLLAGNAIIFSDTNAQKYFWQANKEIGEIFTNYNIDELTKALLQYRNDKNKLTQQRLASFNLGKKLNWESEQKKLLDLSLSIL